MKMLLYYITTILLMATFVIGCFSNPRERSYRQYEQNRDAILEVVEQEAYATYDQDAERRAHYWAEELHVSSQDDPVGQLTLSQNTSADTVPSLLDNNIQNNHPKVKLRNINLKMYRTVAQVTYQLCPETGSAQYETCLLQKQGRHWKVYRKMLQSDESLQTINK